jgi:hypothetical protein
MWRRVALATATSVAVGASVYHYHHHSRSNNINNINNLMPDTRRTHQSSSTLPRLTGIRASPSPSIVQFAQALEEVEILNVDSPLLPDIEPKLDQQEQAQEQDDAVGSVDQQHHQVDNDEKEQQEQPQGDDIKHIDEQQQQQQQQQHDDEDDEDDEDEAHSATITPPSPSASTATKPGTTATAQEPLIVQLDGVKASEFIELQTYFQSKCQAALEHQAEKLSAELDEMRSKV